MNINRLVIGFAIALVMAAALGRVEAEEMLLEGTVAATGITTEIDTNGDSAKAGLNTGIFVSNLGRFTFQNLTELLPPSAPVTCPSGTFEASVLLNRNVLNHEETGDQLFSQITSGALCLTPTGTFSFSVEASFTGGTGQFAGATGSFVFDGTGAILISSAGRSFTTQTGEVTGILIIEEDEDED